MSKLENKEYYKLVRDNILEILKRDKNVVEFKMHTAKDADELIIVILNKIIEEAEELREKYVNNNIIDINEVADLQEILDKLKHEIPYDSEQLKEAINNKALTNGKFELNLVLDSVKQRVEK